MGTTFSQVGTSSEPTGRHLEREVVEQISTLRSFLLLWTAVNGFYISTTLFWALLNPHRGLLLDVNPLIKGNLSTLALVGAVVAFFLAFRASKLVSRQGDNVRVPRERLSKGSRRTLFVLTLLLLPALILLLDRFLRTSYLVGSLTLGAWGTAAFLTFGLGACVAGSVGILKRVRLSRMGRRRVLWRLAGASLPGILLVSVAIMGPDLGVLDSLGTSAVLVGGFLPYLGLELAILGIGD